MTKKLLALPSTPQYSVGQAAGFFPRTEVWLDNGIRSGAFKRLDGTDVTPTIDPPTGTRLFSLDDLGDVALYSRNRGWFDLEEFRGVLSKLLLAAARW